MKAPFLQILATLKWLLGTLVRVGLRQKSAFSWGVVSLGLGKVFHVLAFILPLKVILLAGSEGVPNYTPFIAPADKTLWIYALAAGAIVSYGLTLALELWATRISNQAGVAVSSEATALVIVANQEAESQSIVHGLMGIASSVVFFMIGLFVILLLDPQTFLVMAGLTIASALAAILLLIVPDGSIFGTAKRFLQGASDTYLAINSSVIFLVAFLVILLPFVTGEDANLLAAVISIVLLRRSLAAMIEAVSGALKLLKKRHLVDALMFRDRRLEPKEAFARNPLAETFSRRARRTKVLESLQANLPDHRFRRIDWTDPVVPGITQFSVLGPSGRNSTMQVFESKQRHLLENERRLFQTVPRRPLSMPAEFGEFHLDGFSCRILDVGLDPVERRDWNEVSLAAFESIVELVPPEELEDIYRSIHPMLGERLERRLLRRLDIAVSEMSQLSTLKAFRERLDHIVSDVASLPRIISSPDILRLNAVRLDEDGAAKFLFWGRWTLEPLGAGFMTSLGEKAFEQVCEAAARRPDAGEGPLLEKARLARDVALLLGEIDRGYYGAALERIALMVDCAAHDKRPDLAHGLESAAS